MGTWERGVSSAWSSNHAQKILILIYQDACCPATIPARSSTLADRACIRDIISEISFVDETESRLSFRSKIVLEALGVIGFVGVRASAGRGPSVKWPESGRDARGLLTGEADMLASICTPCSYIQIRETKGAWVAFSTRIRILRTSSEGRTSLRGRRNRSGIRFKGGRK